MHSVLQKSGSMRTLESQTHFLARTALIGSSSIKACQQRSEVYINKSDLRASENLTQLKLTAEKMIQEQASVKTDLQITFSKLEKSEQEVRSLETRLQDTKNENAILRVKQQEALKLWEGLESKFSSTSTFCNQLMETLQQLALQVHEAEQGKQVIEEKLAERLRSYQEIKMQVEDLSLKKQSAESIAANWETEYRELERLQEQSKILLAQEAATLRQLQGEKVEVEMRLQNLNESLDQEKERSEFAEKQLDQIRSELQIKAHELNDIKKVHVDLLHTKNEVDLVVETLKVKLESERSRNAELNQDLETVALKAKDLEDANAVAVNKLLAEIARCKEWAQKESQGKEDTWKDLQDLELRHQELTDLKVALEKQIDDLRDKVQVLNADHETSERRNSEMKQELQNELNITRKKFDEQEKDMFNLERHSQDLETKVAALLATAEDLTNRKEQLVTENRALKMEIGLVTESANRTIQEKADEIEKLSSKILQGTETLALQNSEISQLRQILSEKDQLIESLMEDQKCLKGQFAQVVDQKVSAERLGDEIRRQAETQLETKLMELNKHIREISERNDEEMKEMRKNFENEAKEAIMKEELKACPKSFKLYYLFSSSEMALRHLKATQDIFLFFQAAAMLATTKEEFELKTTKIQELSLVAQKTLQNEHQAQVREIMQNYDAEKKLLVSQYQVELKKSQDFSKQLEEEKKKWMEDFEMKIKELEKKHADEIKKLSSDSSSHCSKAEDRALRLEQELGVLQEQLKEEKFRRQEDSIVATRKFEEAVHNFEADRRVYEENHKHSNPDTLSALQKELEEAKRKLSVWEAKCKSLERDDSKMKAVKSKGLQEHSYPLANQAYSTGVKGVHALSHFNEGRKTETPIEKGKCESATLPTHSKTVTHHEYEVATSDGRKTITRKRTKSTVMFEGQSPLDVKRLGSRKSTRLSSQHRKVKPSRVYATTMGDLFGGKSLDPYADDPYAFT